LKYKYRTKRKKNCQELNIIINMVDQYLFDSEGNWIAFRVGIYLFDIDSDWIGWLPWDTLDVVSAGGKYIGSIYENDRFYYFENTILPLVINNVPYPPLPSFPPYPGYGGFRFLPMFARDIDWLKKF